jgi:voltage-gated potassium channel
MTLDQDLEISLRSRVHAFIETKYDIAWDLAFGVLALVYVGLDIVFENATPETLQLVEATEIAITAIFALEFFVRLWAAPHRRRHLRAHFLDALALIPPIRSLRLLRLARLVAVVARLHRGGMSFEPLAKHKGFVTLVVAWLSLGLICSLALYAAERGLNEAFANPFDALWWAVGSITTVGSDLFPITTEGRFAAMVLMVVGVFLFSAITATITSVLLSTAGIEDDEQRQRLDRELLRLEKLLERLEQVQGGARSTNVAEAGLWDGQPSS